MMLPTQTTLMGRVLNDENFRDRINTLIVNVCEATTENCTFSHKQSKLHDFVFYFMECFDNQIEEVFNVVNDHLNSRGIKLKRHDYNSFSLTEDELNAYYVMDKLIQG